MSQRTRYVFAIAGTALALGVLAWRMWSGSQASAVPAYKAHILCAKCNYHAEVDVSELVADGLAARGPKYGPGYRCPRCRQASAYMNPIVCGHCGTAYFGGEVGDSVDAFKCPKCGKLPS